MTKLSELKIRWMQDPEFKLEYDALADEFAFANMLIEARVQADLTQVQIATRMNTSQSFIARLEGGISNPSIKTLNRYAEATGSKLKISLERQG